MYQMSRFRMKAGSHERDRMSSGFREPSPADEAAAQNSSQLRHVTPRSCASKASRVTTQAPLRSALAAGASLAMPNESKGNHAVCTCRPCGVSYREFCTCKHTQSSPVDEPSSFHCTGSRSELSRAVMKQNSSTVTIVGNMITSGPLLMSSHFVRVFPSMAISGPSLAGLCPPGLLAVARLVSMIAPGGPRRLNLISVKWTAVAESERNLVGVNLSILNSRLGLASLGAYLRSHISPPGWTMLAYA
mmetsp:Transcript_102748/g.290559  ORF Transcript_102748/g.290559 Transcript_102748/m.290559 type:complete len:246 (-) Transcript_102748:401-1138(-)